MQFIPDLKGAHTNSDQITEYKNEFRVEDIWFATTSCCSALGQNISTWSDTADQNGESYLGPKTKIRYF